MVVILCDGLPFNIKSLPEMYSYLKGRHHRNIKPKDTTTTNQNGLPKHEEV
jgi:hypothetical protein